MKRGKKKKKKRKFFLEEVTFELKHEEYISFLVQS